MEQAQNKFETVAVADLIHDPANVRKHDARNLDAIKGSLARFGQQKPIVVDADGVVVAGNGTLAAAKSLGWTDIDVVRSSLKGAEATAYAIADNRTAELAEWDDSALAETLAALQNDDSIDHLAAGFTDDEIEKIVSGVTGLANVVEGETPEPPAKPVTKVGDLILMGDHRLLCGDATKAEDVERLMDGDRADLCFTSPPYNLGSAVALRNGARKGSSSAYNDMTDTGEGWPELMCGFVSLAMAHCDVVAVNVQMLAGNKVDLCGLIGKWSEHIIDVSVWVKSNPPPAMADGVMTSGFEFIFLMSPDKKPTRRIHTATFDRGTFSNVFENAIAAGHDASIHGAVFPIGVAVRFVGSMSAAGSIVFEPFCGSGTTLIAAEQLGRKCYGIEISPAYCDVIVERWENLTGGKASRE